MQRRRSAERLAEIDGDGSVYQASSSRTAKPALDGDGCGQRWARIRRTSNKQQKEIIEELKGVESAPMTADGKGFFEKVKEFFE